jgi:Uma2 family endonuclease
VYRPGQENKGTYAFLDINSTLDGEDVLPGFQLNLSELFAEA